MNRIEIEKIIFLYREKKIEFNFDLTNLFAQYFVV